MQRGVAGGANIDLSSIPIIDVHCHAVSAEHALLKSAEHFAQLTSLGAMGVRAWPAGQATQRMFFRRLTKEIANFLGCEAAPEVVVAARNARGGEYDSYVCDLMADANIELLLVDTGYPRDPAAVNFLRGLGLPMRTIFRIEPLIADLCQQHPDFDSFNRAFLDDCVRQVNQEGNVGLKSVIAYRTGLAIDLVAQTEAKEAYPAFVANIRPAAKIVRDFLIAEIAEVCLDLDVPLQLHTGIGDAGIDLNLARPALLGPLLSRYSQLKLVLVHGGYPWVEEAACLCHLYPYVYLDLSEWVPLAYPGLGRKVLEALNMAPASRIVYGSDGFNVPEIHWMAARLGREAIAFALETLLGEGVLATEEGETIARMILAENSRELYRL